MGVSRIARILAKIDSRCVWVDRGYETACHEWTGPDSGEGRGGGYGRFSCDGGTMAVHVASWVCQNGPIPPRKTLDHKCRNRRCRRDDHLELVTHKQNCKRRDAAKRAPVPATGIFRCTSTTSTQLSPH